MTEPRIPKKIPLYKGKGRLNYTVHVKQVSALVMKNRFQEDLDGIWDDSTKTIYLKKNLKKMRKWYIYGHELVHAVNDWNHWMSNMGIAQA